MEIFFDYACPFCLKAFEYLLEIKGSENLSDIYWRPCEAHPRPERYGKHSDLCARGMYFILSKNADIIEYHRIMFSAACRSELDIENPTVLSELVRDLVDQQAFLNCLNSEDYVDKLNENNFLAWNKHRFAAVPSFIKANKILLSVENIGISKQMLENFLQ